MLSSLLENFQPPHDTLENNLTSFDVIQTKTLGYQGDIEFVPKVMNSSNKSNVKFIYLEILAQHVTFDECDHQETKPSLTRCLFGA